MNAGIRVPTGQEHIFVIRRLLNVLAQIHYDPERSEAWDDEMRLLSDEEEGATYDQTVALVTSGETQRDGRPGSTRENTECAIMNMEARSMHRSNMGAGPTATSGRASLGSTFARARISLRVSRTKVDAGCTPGADHLASLAARGESGRVSSKTETSLGTWRPPARQRWSVSDGEGMLAAFSGSGPSKSEFARRQGSNPQRIDYWTRRLSRHDSDCNRRSAGVLVPVQLEEDSSPNRADSLRFVAPNGWHISVERGFDDDTLRSLIDLFAKASS